MVAARDGLKAAELFASGALKRMMFYECDGKMR
jgi:hypothetical protein